MSTIAALRSQAEKIKAQLRDAEAKAEQAAAERAARNVARRREFWATAGSRCEEAHAAVNEAKARVLELVASGQLEAAREGYLDYLRRHSEAVAVVDLARQATAEYVYREGQAEKRIRVDEWPGAVTPGGSNTRIEYAPGVTTGIAHRDVVSFQQLTDEGLSRFREAHTVAFKADLLAPLLAVLEPEDE